MAFAGDVRAGGVDSAAGGDITIVAAVPGKRIMVFGYVLVASGVVAVRWKSGANNLSGAMALAANGGLVVHGGTDTAWMVTNPGEALVLNAGAAIQVSGHVIYGVR